MTQLLRTRVFLGTPDGRLLDVLEKLPIKDIRIWASIKSASVGTASPRPGDLWLDLLDKGGNVQGTEALRGSTLTSFADLMALQGRVRDEFMQVVAAVTALGLALESVGQQGQDPTDLLRAVALAMGGDCA